MTSEPSCDPVPVTCPAYSPKDTLSAPACTTPVYSLAKHPVTINERRIRVSELVLFPYVLCTEITVCGYRLAKCVPARTCPRCPRTQAYPEEKEETWEEVNQQPECGQARRDSEDTIGCLLRGEHNSARSSLRTNFESRLYADRLLPTSLGFTPHFPGIQTF